MNPITLSNIRNEQKNQLEFAIRELQIAEKKVNTAFYDMPDNINNMSYYFNTIEPLNCIVDNIKNRISYLTTELINKKYANKYQGKNIYPFEVIKEININEYIIRELKCTETETSKYSREKTCVIKGIYGAQFDNSKQNWNIESDNTNVEFKIRRHKDGNWYDRNGIKYQISDKPTKFYDFNLNF